MNVLSAIHESFDPTLLAETVSQRPVPVLLTDEATFCDWIAQAAPGASVVYFRGHLASDRMPSAGTFGEPERKRLVAVARRALQSAEDSLVHLVQRRHGVGDYSYMAVKAHVRRPGRLMPAGATAGR